MFLRLTFLAVMSLLLKMGGAEASMSAGNHPGHVLLQLDSPVRIDYCEIQANNNIRLDRPNFTNVSDKIVVDVRFLFSLRNTFDEVVDKDYPVISGRFSKGSEIKSKSVWFDDYSSGVTSNVCSVDTVKFDDGSVWKAPK